MAQRQRPAAARDAALPPSCTAPGPVRERGEGEDEEQVGNELKQLCCCMKATKPPCVSPSPSHPSCAEQPAVMGAAFPSQVGMVALSIEGQCWCGVQVVLRR